MTELNTIRRVAVLGAGSMGLQLAAHLANACLDVILFDLADPGTNPVSGLQHKLARLNELQPPALAVPGLVRAIRAATFQHDLAQLRRCDLIIETTRELCDCKEGVLARIAPYIDKHALVSSTTDTVSIERLAHALPEAVRSRFFGLHFLIPPRYTRLVELAPADSTDERVLDHIERFAVSVLGKQVVRVKDSPLYIADRCGVFVTACALKHGQALDLPLEIMDGLLARTFGMPTGGVFGAIDRLGVSRFMRVVEYAQAALVDDIYIQQIQWPQALLDLERGVQAIFYRQENGRRMSLDTSTGQYRPISPTLLPDAPDWRLFIHQSMLPEAQFLRRFLADLFWYAATHLEHMARSCAEFDLALRFAFGLKYGVFELWQRLGWESVLHWGAELDPKIVTWPGWVINSAGAYKRKGAYTPAEQDFKPYRFGTAYARQLKPPVLPGERAASDVSCPYPGLELWRIDAQFSVLTVQESQALYDLNALDAWQDCFSELLAEGRGVVLELRSSKCNQSFEVPSAPDLWLDKLSRLYLQIRYSSAPVICTLNGQISKPLLAIALSCTQRFIALNTCLHSGSAGIALPAVPGLGHALLMQLVHAPNTLSQQIQAACLAGTILSKPMSVSAAVARQYCVLPATDTIVLNPAELSGMALAKLRHCLAIGYQPPPPWPVSVLGQDSVDTVRSLLHDQFSELDPSVKNWQAPFLKLLCGGDNEPGSLLRDEAILALEQECYLRLWAG